MINVVFDEIKLGNQCPKGVNSWHSLLTFFLETCINVFWLNPKLTAATVEPKTKLIKTVFSGETAAEDSRNLKTYTTLCIKIRWMLGATFTWRRW